MFNLYLHINLNITKTISITLDYVVSSENPGFVDCSIFTSGFSGHEASLNFLLSDYLIDTTQISTKTNTSINKI